MTAVDFGRYKRMVQGYFESEPKNDDVSGSAIWCLGSEYTNELVANGVVNGTTDEVSLEEVIDTRYPANMHAEASTVTKTLDSTKARDAVDEREDRSKDDRAWPSDFLDDCESRIWLTYRSGFPPIPKSPGASVTLSVRLRNLAGKQGFTSDTGWGCMIRSGQCLLANALSIMRLGRGRRRGAMQASENQLLSLFADDPMAPFSIHRFVEHGAQACGKHPGEWFGPSATARCIQALSHDYEEATLKVYVNGDGADVYEDHFLKLAKSTEGVFTPTLILLGLRLGIDRVTPAYWQALKSSLELPQSVGIAGGRPSSSHYFFAHQNDHFFYLDPHFTRPALPLHADPADYSSEEIESCHTRKLRRLPLTDMDPSMLLAFIIGDEQDWISWRKAVTASPGKAVVHVADSEPSLRGRGADWQSALDEVETLDDDEDDFGHDNGGKRDSHGAGHIELFENV